MTDLEQQMKCELELKDARISRLEEELAILKKALFGPKSEKIITPVDHPELGLDLPDPSEPQKQEVEKPKAKSRKGIKLSRFEIPEDLPRKEVRIDIPEEEKFCPHTGKPLRLWKEEISEKLAYKPGSYYVIRYIRPLYKSPEAPEAGVISAGLPDSPIDRCRADTSLFAYILVMKFADHLPLYRIEEILKRDGMSIQRQTLCGWVLKLGESLMPIYELMFEKVLAGDRLFTDATGLNYMIKGKGSKKGYIWVYCGGEKKAVGKSPPYLVYQFTPDGKHTHPEKVLNKFKGLMHSDAHQAYEKAALRDDLLWQACLAHARRKFTEAQGGPPEIKTQIIEIFKKLFLNERQAWEMSAVERLKYRQVEQKPLMDKLMDIIKEQVNGPLLPSSKYKQALNYMASREKHFRTFLDNPMALIDNNLSERTIKPLVIGRKNWLFLGNKDSGKSTAAILSLVQTCRHLKINPAEYLEDVLRRINAHNSQKLDELLPDQWAALRSSKKEA